MSISDTSIKRNAPFSPSLWGFVSRLSDECPHKCLLIIPVLADGPGHFAFLHLRHTEDAVGSFYLSFHAVTYFVKVNFRSFLALMGRFLYQFNSCVLSAIKAILSANVRCVPCTPSILCERLSSAGPVVENLGQGSLPGLLRWAVSY